MASALVGALAALLACGAPGADPEPPAAPAAVVPPPPRCDPGSLPVAVDVGHSPEKPGATSARGQGEYHFNRALADTLLAELASQGFDGSFRIDAADAALSLTARPRRASQGGAAVLLSLHHDSVQPHYLQDWRHPDGPGRYADNFSGFSLWIAPDAPAGPQSRELGQALGAALLASGHRPTLHHAEPIPGEDRELLDADVGLYRRDTLAVLRTSTLPTVLVEAGVIVNRADELRLRDPDWQQGFAQALAAGLTAYCAATAPGPTP